jgi:hypothetical protein
MADNACLWVATATRRSFASRDRNASTSGATHLRRMVFQLMEAHERPHRMDIDLLDPYAVVQITNALTHLIQQARRPQRRQGTPDAFHG